MSGAHRDTTIAARVPLDLAADLQRVVELERARGVLRADGEPVDKSTIQRRAVRAYCDAAIAAATPGATDDVRPQQAGTAAAAYASGRLFAQGAGAARPSDPATSKAAARDVAPRVGSQRRRALEVIVRAGERGATADEVIAYIEQTTPARRVAVNGVARRVTDLLQAAAVRELRHPSPAGDVTGARDDVVTRTTRNGSAATVYVATAKGREWLNANRSQETPR